MRCKKKGISKNVYFHFKGKRFLLCIKDNAVTPSIRIAQVFSALVGKKTRAIWKVYGGMLKYIINYALYSALYDAYFQVNDDAKKCRYLSVTNNLNYLIFH